MTPWILLGVSLLLVAACGVFVAAEFSLVAVDRATVERAAAEGDAGAAGVQQALRTLSTQLSGAQVGITVTNLAIGFLAEPAIATIVRGPMLATGLPESTVTPVALATGLALGTALTMIFGELVPKNLAIARPLETARATQRLQRGFTAAIALPIRGLNGSANALVRRLGLEPQEELRSARSSQELASLISRSADQGTLDADTAELMERSVEFATRTAGEIMTPRVRTTTIEASDRVEAVIEAARATGHSRFPVLDAEDAVVGTVHVKHAVALPVHERATTRVKHVMVRPIVVPDSLRLDPLLALLREDGFQMAVVLDEYGGHAGIVTLEDVVEEIVGDIADEHDRLGARVQARRDGSWSLSGLLRPDEVEDATGVELPTHEDYDTVAGLVVRQLGRVPTPGDLAEVSVPDRSDPDEPRERLAVLTVERMDGLRVDRLTLRVHGPEEAPAARAGAGAAGRAGEADR
ncbi:hemolysin family protein [Nocardioides perillae]|uniref:CBS domain containing-hemolysin-like protein n=1 Tax=Nocardioides perillae TaxID=1119534 RepID=A0A7Y9UV91_9ACTN|nr:hemolysin family protein [Nocardioides perillae]NYG55965.1 CBS domain containing-hemolysin-like protein [Nocardioides perillae]